MSPSLLKRPLASLALRRMALLVGWTAIAVGCSPQPREAASAPQQAPSAPQLEVIEAPGAPPAIGPYSQAIRAGNTVYLAGQIGMDPTTGILVSGGIEPETRQVMENLRSVLNAAGLGFEHVVLTQIFVQDLDEFATLNEVYGSYFQSAPPARATVEVARLPRDARVEILMTAVGPTP